MKKRIEKPCAVCGATVVRTYFKPGSKTTCSKVCLSELRKTLTAKPKIEKPCIVCGTMVTRVPSQMLAVACCSLTCSKQYMRKRLAGLNRELNPTRMTPEVKKKLREANLGKGDKKTYTKIHGRHTHRIVMEKKLGRGLKSDEIVHHIDGDIFNNNPENLQLVSRREHLLLHLPDMLEARRRKNSGV